MNIRTKFLAVMLALVLITGMATILIGRTISTNIIEEQVGNHLETTAQSRAHHIETVIAGYEQMAQTAASGNAFRCAVGKNTNHTKSMEKVNLRINSVIQNHGDISRIGVLDKSGIVIASSHADTGYDKSTSEIFMEGKEEVYVGDIHTSVFTGNKVISVAAPILVDGEFSGVIILDFDAEEIFGIVTDRTGLGETGEIFIINRGGYMITPSRFISDTLKQDVDPEHFDSTENHEPAAALYKNYCGLEVIGAHAPIPAMNWCLRAEIDEREAFAPVTRLTITMFSALLGLLLLGTLICIRVSGTITDPIVRLQHGTEELMKGNLDHKVGTGTEDEVGELSRAFDIMTANLKESGRELEEHSKGLEAKEERIEHLNSVLKAIRDIDHLIVTEKDRDHLLKKACDILTETRGYEAAWLGSLSDGETFDSVVGSGFREDVDRFCESVVDGNHPFCIKKALAGKETVVVIDKSGECGDCPFKDAHDGKETVVIRVERGGKLFGLLAISLAANVTLDEEEEGLLEEVASDIALALRDMELEGAHRAAEEALHQSEIRFRTLVEHLPTVTYTAALDEMSTTLYVSPPIEKILGIPPEEYEADPDFWLKHLHDEDRERVLKEFNNAHETGMPLISEYRMISTDGRIVWLRDEAVIIKDEKGKPLYLQGIMSDITERRNTEDQIKASLKEKEVLLREIHHRVKNNLQVVSSLLDMQARGASNKDTIDVLTESKDRINAMALIHAQLYESRDLAEINMKEFVDKLLMQVFQSYPVQGTKITPVISVVDYPFPISMAVPVGLIVNELLSNALKHAFASRNEGTIEVSLTASEEGRINLRVSDDGAGLPDGFDINATGTLGLRLVKILTEDQLRGNLEVISKEGTTFNIEFDIRTNSGV